MVCSIENFTMSPNHRSKDKGLYSLPYPFFYRLSQCSAVSFARSRTRPAVVGPTRLQNGDVDVNLCLSCLQPLAYQCSAIVVCISNSELTISAKDAFRYSIPSYHWNIRAQY